MASTLHLALTQLGASRQWAPHHLPESPMQNTTFLTSKEYWLVWMKYMCMNRIQIISMQVRQLWPHKRIGVVISMIQIYYRMNHIFWFFIYGWMISLVGKKRVIIFNLPYTVICREEGSNEPWETDWNFDSCEELVSLTPWFFKLSILMFIWVSCIFTILLVLVFFTHCHSF